MTYEGMAAPPIFFRSTAHFLVYLHLSRKMKVLLVIVALIVAQTTAHLCLLFPHQRGTAQGLNMAGSKDCQLVMNPPCGGRPAQTPEVMFMPGEKVSIIFQKNLDHFWPPSPGTFDVMIGEMADDIKFTKLLSIPDTSSTSPIDYSPYIVLPNMTMKHAVLQMIYNTSNPTTVPAFYQCADVSVMPMEERAVHMKRPTF